MIRLFPQKPVFVCNWKVHLLTWYYNIKIHVKLFQRIDMGNISYTVWVKNQKQKGSDYDISY